MNWSCIQTIKYNWSVNSQLVSNNQTRTYVIKPASTKIVRDDQVTSSESEPSKKKATIKKPLKKKKFDRLVEKLLPKETKNPFQSIISDDMNESDTLAALEKLDVKMTQGLKVLLGANPQLSTILGQKFLENKDLITTLKPGPTRAMIMHGVMNDVMKREMKDIRASDKKLGNPPLKISCGLGCAACCHRLVYITNEEAQVYFSLLEEMEGGSVSDTTLNRLEYQAQFKPEQEFEFQLLPKEKSKCVFLNESNQACKIYEHRPMACRRHQVTSDPLLCSPKNTKISEKEIPTNLYLPLTETLASAAHDLEKGKGFTTMSQAILQEIDKKAFQNLKDYNKFDSEIEKEEKAWLKKYNNNKKVE